MRRLGIRPWLQNARRTATRTQRQSLLRLIALAIEHRIPVVPLLRQFAEDQTGAQRDRIRRLAGLLNEGILLPDALEQVEKVLPVEYVLAIRFGTQSGTLSTTLRDLIEDSERSENGRIGERLRATLVYPAVVLPIFLGIVTFLFIMIWPVFDALLSNMALERPDVFQWTIDVSGFCMAYWWLVAGAGLLMAWILWTEKPGRFLRRSLVRPWFDFRSADVLQSLSAVAEAGRPLSGAVSTLARYHDDPTLRQKLLFVCNEIELGADLWPTLQKVKLLTPAEVTLMRASERVGNRAWVMAQLAMCKRRRIRRRLEVLSQLVEPTVVVLFGAAVFAMCLGVFGPLLKLLLHSA